MKTLNKAFFKAAEKGNYDLLVSLLDQGVNPKANSSVALRMAVDGNHIKCVKLLIEVSEPEKYNSEALRCAAKKGYVECVKLLIPVSEPHALNFIALRAAVRNGHAECVKLLIPVSNIDIARKKLILAGESVFLLDAILQEKVLKERFDTKISKCEVCL